jgi:hypothetical protein
MKKIIISFLMVLMVGMIIDTSPPAYAAFDQTEIVSDLSNPQPILTEMQLYKSAIHGAQMPSESIQQNTFHDLHGYDFLFPILKTYAHPIIFLDKHYDPGRCGYII